MGPACNLTGLAERGMEIAAREEHFGRLSQNAMALIPLAYPHGASSDQVMTRFPASSLTP